MVILEQRAAASWLPGEHIAQHRKLAAEGVGKLLRLDFRSFEVWYDGTTSSDFALGLHLAIRCPNSCMELSNASTSFSTASNSARWYNNNLMHSILEIWRKELGFHEQR